MSELTRWYNTKTFTDKNRLGEKHNKKTAIIIIYCGTHVWALCYTPIVIRLNYFSFMYAAISDHFLTNSSTGPCSACDGLFHGRMDIVLSNHNRISGGSSSDHFWIIVRHAAYKAIPRMCLQYVYIHTLHLESRHLSFVTLWNLVSAFKSSMLCLAQGSDLNCQPSVTKPSPYCHPTELLPSLVSHE